MKVEMEKASSLWLYGDRVPHGIDSDQEIPTVIRFEMEELVSENGYFVTPIDGLFRNSLEKLGFTSDGARAIFTRSQSPPIMRVQSEGGALKFWARNEAEEDEKSHIRYCRHLFGSYHTDFDVLETGDEINSNIVNKGLWDLISLETREARLEKLIELIKRKPFREEIDFKLPRMEMKLDMSYPRDKYKSELTIKTEVPWLGEHGKTEIKRNLEGVTDEEYVQAIQEIIDKYLAQFVS